MDIATLGLTIENGQAVLTITQTGNALDVLGQKGDEAAAKVEKVGKAARSASTDHESLIGTTARSTREMGALAAMQAELTGKMGEHTFAVGRLERSLESLVAEMTGVNDTAALAATSLAKFGLGEIESLGILAGLAAIVALYDKVTESARAAAEEQDKAIASLEHMLHLKAVGPAGEEVDQRGQLGDRMADLRAQRDTLDASWRTLVAEANKRGQTIDPQARQRYETNRAAITNQLAPLEKLDTAVGIDIQNKNAAEINAVDARHAHELASLITHHQATKDEYAKAEQYLREHRARLAEIRRTHPADELSVAAAISDNISTVDEALHPKRDAEAANALAKARFDDLMKELDETRASLIRILPEGVKPGTMDVFGFFNQTNPLDEKTIARGAASELGRQPNDFRDTLDRAAVMQAQFDATNAMRELHGQKALAPTKDLLDAKREAADMGAAMIDAVTHSNRSWEEQRRIIAEIVKLMRDAGVESKDTAPPAHGLKGWAQAHEKEIDKAASGLHSAGDLANLIGGQRGEQWGNILNTAGNAATNVTAAIASGGTDIAADAQAVLSVASLGKEVFGLGKQSHDAARQVAEAREAIKTMLAALQASVGHDALGALLAQAQSAYDAQKKQINDDLSGKKKEKERNADLAQLDALYAQQRQQIVQQYGEKQVLDEESLQARLLRAKGLTYQADVADLAVKQQQEYNQAVIDGRDATYLATLAQVQLAEKTALANQAITQLANSPTGFFAERYFGQFASPATALPASIATAQAGGAGSNNTSVTAQTINITVPGTSDPTATAHAVVRVFRTIRDQTVGSSGTIADAMEVM